MFTVSETEATAIREAFHNDGEFSATIEFRRLFPGITDTAKARYWGAGDRWGGSRGQLPRLSKLGRATELEHMNGVWTG